MSAVTPIADEGGCGRIVRFVPNSGHSSTRTFTDKNGLRELVEQSSVGETAANHVN
jgi:hypothetical protein